MARVVLNTFSLRVSKNHRDEMLDAMITILLDVESKKTSKGIASALNMQANLGGKKIKVLELYTGLHLTSGWGPALEAQDGLCKLLSKVDERVVLANSYADLSGSPVGKRYVTFHNGCLEEFHCEDDVSEEIAELKSLQDKAIEYHDEGLFSELGRDIEDLIDTISGKMDSEMQKELFRKLPDRREQIELKWPGKFEIHTKRRKFSRAH